MEYALILQLTPPKDLIEANYADVLSNKWALALLVLCIVQIIWFWARRGGQVFEDMRGEDKHWEAPEVISMMALFIWAPIILANHFFHYNMTAEAWESMKWVMSISVGSRVVLDGIDKWKGGDKPQPPVTPTT